MSKVTIKEMLEAGVHFGHRTRYWHPRMHPYIFGTRHGIHIINLDKTLPKFIEALNFLGRIVMEGGDILFVGTKRSASKVVKKEAIRCEMPYVNHRWLGGMMTNYSTIKESIKRLNDLEYYAEEGFHIYNKKETLKLQRELNNRQRSLGGIQSMERLPKALFIIDTGHERIAVNEAKKLNIPVVAVVDTNYNPEGIDYVIPGNDDSIHSNRLYARYVANAVLETKLVMAQNSTNSIESDDKELVEEASEIETKITTQDKDDNAQK